MWLRGVLEHVGDASDWAVSLGLHCACRPHVCSPALLPPRSLAGHHFCGTCIREVLAHGTRVCPICRKGGCPMDRPVRFVPFGAPKPAPLACRLHAVCKHLTHKCPTLSPQASPRATCLTRSARRRRASTLKCARRRAAPTPTTEPRRVHHAHILATQAAAGYTLAPTPVRACNASNTLPPC